MYRALRFSFITVVLLAGNSFGDDSRPLFIQIDEMASQQYKVYIKVPQTARVAMDAQLKTADFCDASTTIRQTTVDGSLLKSYQLNCDRALQGSPLTVELNTGGVALYSLIKFTDHRQRRFSKLLEPDESQWKIPIKTTIWQVINEYTAFGISHMLTGYDHLLFVCCLLFICRVFNNSAAKKRWQLLLMTITGFTLGHSITLGMSALALVSINIQAVEITIALSIAFLAAEIVRFNRHPQRPLTITYRYPALVSSGFGLLHGFGFASLLNDFGLPYDQTLLGLVAFNLGIEIGQLAFVATTLLTIGLLSKLLAKHLPIQPSQLNSLVVYLIGAVAMYWAIQRI